MSAAKTDSASDEKETSNQTLKPAGNGVQNTTTRKGSPMRRQSLDQAENARPTENSKPEQQRWPGMSTGKVFTGSMTRSMDLSVDKERPLTRQSSITRPGTPSSRTKATVSRTYSRIGNDSVAAPPRRNPTPTRGRTTESVANGDGNGDHARRLSQDSIATTDSLSTPVDIMSDTESVSSAGSVPGSRVVRGTTVPARVWQDMNNR